jgi:hypothetical protein
MSCRASWWRWRACLGWWVGVMYIECLLSPLILSVDQKAEVRRLCNISPGNTGRLFALQMIKNRTKQEEFERDSSRTQGRARNETGMRRRWTEVLRMFSNQSARELSPRLRLDRADGRVEGGSQCGCCGVCRVERNAGEVWLMSFRSLSGINRPKNLRI